MRRSLASLSLGLLLTLPAAFAQSSGAKLTHVPTEAVPTTGAQYPLYQAPADLRVTKSDQDLGSAQKPFVLATQPDDLASSAQPPTANNLPPETLRLDPRIKIQTIHEVETDSNYSAGGNEALEFELKYLFYGAVSSEQYEARRGHYFTISWRNQGPRDNALLTRFQYREVVSKDIVRTLVQPLAAPKKNNRSYFAVVGQAFHAYGPINAWRITILKGETVIAEEKSISW